MINGLQWSSSINKQELGLFGLVRKRRKMQSDCYMSLNQVRKITSRLLDASAVASSRTTKRFVFLLTTTGFRREQAQRVLGDSFWGKWGQRSPHVGEHTPARMYFGDT